MKVNKRLKHAMTVKKYMREARCVQKVSNKRLKLKQSIVHNDTLEKCLARPNFTTHTLMCPIHNNFMIEVFVLHRLQLRDAMMNSYGNNALPPEFILNLKEQDPSFAN